MKENKIPYKIYLEEKEMPEYIKALQIKKYTYTVNNREFTLNKLSENMLPPRSYFVPCSGEAVCDIGDYPKSNVFSDRMFSLSGEWDFAYFEENGKLLEAQRIKERTMNDIEMLEEKNRSLEM